MSNGEIWENLPDEVSADGDGDGDDDDVVHRKSATTTSDSSSSSMWDPSSKSGGSFGWG